MDFEYLMDLVARNQFDEIKVIGKTIVSQGRPYHFLAMVRQGDQAQLCVMAQTEPWSGRMEPDDGSMRQSMKSQLRSISSVTSVSKIKINDLLLESGGGEFGTLDMSSSESQMLLSRLIDAGWSLPKDSVFYGMEWNCIEMMRSRIRTPLKKLPNWENAKVCVTWGADMREYFIEKRVRLTVDDEDTGSMDPQDAGVEAASTREIEFSIVDKDGQKREAVCYINSVALIDVWAEHEKQFADPQYQKIARERISEEEFEAMKQRVYQALEQECPRGMCQFGLEYECTLDLNLQFYSSEYLETKPKEYISEGSVSLYMSIPKADKEYGTHGLKLRACVIHTPVAPDTKKMWAELFSACELIPEREEVLEF